MTDQQLAEIRQRDAVRYPHFMSQAELDIRYLLELVDDVEALRQKYQRDMERQKGRLPLSYAVSRSALDELR